MQVVVVGQAGVSACIQSIHPKSVNLNFQLNISENITLFIKCLILNREDLINMNTAKRAFKCVIHCRWCMVLGGGGGG